MSARADETVDISAAVVDSSPDAIITVDLDNRIIGWNAAAERMTGFTAVEAVGRDVASLIPKAQRTAAAAILERVRAGETIRGREVSRLRSDGSRMVGILTVAPVRAADGTVRGTVGIMHDVSQQRAVEEFLRRNERLASVGTLAAGVAHEINNPIGGILMAAQYARGALGKPDASTIVEKALGDIEEDAVRCAAITKRLLRFANEERAERSECNVNEVIESALGIALRDLEAMSVETRFEPNHDLPRVIVSRPEIEQTLINLIDNALEAQSSSIAIEVDIDVEASSFSISVRDDGAGIPEAVLDHLFDPFYTTKRGGGGAGLGLSLAHAIVHDHGGSLDVASSPRQGTTVRLTLPLVAETKN